MRIFKFLLKTIAFIVLVIIINSLLTFIFKPYLGSSAEMWSTYSTKENLSMVYTGSSQCISGIRPDYIDATTGLVSYNMGTNMQSIHNSKRAMAKAIKEHDIKIVFAVIDFETLSQTRYSNFRAEASFQQAENKTESLGTRLINDFTFITDKEIINTPGSINYFFPWIYDRDTNIKLNIREKCAGQVLDESGHRDTYGFESSYDVVEDSAIFITLNEARSWSEESKVFSPLYIRPEVREELVEIAELCRENDVQLIAASIPYGNHFSVYKLSDYQAVTNELNEIFSGDNTVYYDFNLIKPEYFEVKRSYYKDVGHLNIEGATAFSEFLGEFIVTSQTQDVSDYFYDINEY